MFLVAGVGPAQQLLERIDLGNLGAGRASLLSMLIVVIAGAGGWLIGRYLARPIALSPALTTQQKKSKLWMLFFSGLVLYFLLFAATTLEKA